MVRLTVADALVGLEMVSSESSMRSLTIGTIGSRRPRPPRPTTRVVDLVQGLDECIISYSHSRDALRPLPPTPGEATVFAHAILLDGRLIGHWRREFDKKTVVVEASLYRPLNGTEIRALEAAVERYGSFEGAPTRLIVTKGR